MQTTLLIYMAADNNLEYHAENDLERIIESSQNSSMNIVVQYDTKEFIDSANTLRLFIENGEVVKEENLGELNTGDPFVLKEFIEIASAFYVADKTILIIWSHGSGIDDMDFYDEEVSRERYFVPKEDIEAIAVGFDDSAGDFLDNLELKKALDTSIKIDVLGFDVCLMGMFEIAYQLRNETKVMVASQHKEPAAGWNYPRILGELEIDESAVDIGKQLIQFHDEHHTAEKQNVTQSALDTSTIDQVAKELDKFALVLREALKERDREVSHKALYYTLDSSQFFERKDYVDLVDFVVKVQNRLAFEVLEPYVESLLNSLQKLVVANHNTGSFVNEANGVSIYFPYENRPFQKTFEMYEKLDFAQACPNWLKLLKWYWI